jgi:signal transduction histidine kinase/DNA-binding NarL/FixJ family response regulator
MALSCLIVDDSEEFLASATRLLRVQGLTVVGRASSGEAALSLAQALRPDVTLVDVELGDEDGIELARRLTATVPSTQVILVSGRDRGELSELLAESGAVGFLRKDTLDAQAICDLLSTGPAAGPSPNPRSASEEPEDAKEVLREEVALRRVATLVAEEAPQSTIFDAVVLEATGLLGPARVRIERVADPACLDETISRIAQGADVDHVIGAPIGVGGVPWGVLAAVPTTAEPQRAGARVLLDGFSELVARAVSNAQARDELRKLAEQQGALRRVATLVAQGAGLEQVFDAIAEEASRILGVKAMSLGSYDARTKMFTQMAWTHGPRSSAEWGQWSLDDSHLGGLMVRTGRPARIDDWGPLSGPIAERYRENGLFQQAASAPILLEGSVWGFIAGFAERDEILPLGCEERLAEFTQLMATAIANIQALDELRGLAESQGALRRVATLVAQGAEPKAVFAAVALEASRVIGVGAVSLFRYDAAEQVFTKIFGTHGERALVPDGARVLPEDCPEGALVVQTGQPARIKDWAKIPGAMAARHLEQGFGEAVAAPVLAGGEIWGHIGAYCETGQVLPAGCETRLADFTQLMASAIANADARDELRGLAEKQGAALRRVAALVAQQASSRTIFTAVAEEASRALGVTRVDVGRCHEDGSVTLLGSAGRADLGTDHALTKSGEQVAAQVTATRRTARIDDWFSVPDREDGIRSAVGAPIMVEGSLWGVTVVLSGERLPDDAESRLTDFTYLVASSISNVNARNNLMASRARVVAASDETRRRIERNIHDGVQQRLVSLGLSLRALREELPASSDVHAGLDEMARDLESVVEEIRIFSQGLHPALLSRSGLGPSLRALARRSPIKVSLDVLGGRRFPEPIETAVYYVVSEALANATKHSRASGVSVMVVSDGEVVRATIADDGVGGALLGRGSGLIGLIDRVESLGGRLMLESPVARGTTISIELPLAPQVMDDLPTL